MSKTTGKTANKKTGKAAGKRTRAEIQAEKRAKQAAFLDAFAKCGQVRTAAEIAGISRQAHSGWLREPEYRERFKEAEAEAARVLEDEAVRRAVEGVKRYKFDKHGNPLMNPITGEPYYEYAYSDTLLIFLLKGLMPDRYRERVQAEITGKDGGPLQIVVSDLPTEVYGNGTAEEAENPAGPGKGPGSGGAEAPAT